MNWHERHHGWTCRDCGAYNANDNAVCDGDVCRADRRREEWDDRRRLRERCEFRDEVVVPSEHGSHKYRARRYAGGRVVFRVLAPFVGVSCRVEWHRVPSSVRWAATAFFGR